MPTLKDIHIAKSHKSDTRAKIAKEYVFPYAINRTEKKA